MIEKIVNSIKNPKNPAIIILYILTIFVISISYFIMGDSLLVVVESNSSIVNRLLISGYAFFYFTVYSFLFIFVLKTLFFLLKKIKIPFTEKISDFLLISFIPTILILTFIDQQLYTLLGIHINSHLLIQNLSQLQREANIDFNNIFIFIIIFFIFSFVIYFLYRILKKYVNKIPNIIYLLLLIINLLIQIFIILEKSQKLETIWLYMLNKNNYTYLREKIELNYNPTEKITLKNKKNILFIVSESLRYDMLNEDIFPNLMKYTKEKKCIISENHFSSSHSTVGSIFSMLYSLDSYYNPIFEKYFSQNQYKSSYIMDIFKDNGYLSYGGFASDINKFSNDVINNFSYNINFTSKKIYAKNANDYDIHIINWLKKNYNNHNKNIPAIFFMFFVSTHYGYDYPIEFEKFPTTMKTKGRILFNSTLAKKQNKNDLFNRYKNSAYYTDSLIKELFDVFSKEIEKNELIVVFTGDHGEEFWEYGGYGHASISFYNPRIQVPLVICLPKRDSEKIYLSSHIDIFPTIIDYLGGDMEKLSKFITGKSLLKDSGENRYIITSSYGFPVFDKKMVALISTNGKLWLEKISDSIDKINEFLILKKTDINDVKIDEIPINLKNQLDDFKKNGFGRFFKKSK